jgi:hypothetical protein
LFPDDLEREDRMTTAESISNLHRAMADKNASQRELFRAIVDCNERRAWLEDDTRDIAHWVSLKLDISNWKARRWVACAHKLEELPVIERAFVEGALSADKLVELTRFATPDNEREALGWALDRSTAAVRDRADEETRINPADVKRAERYRSLTWEWTEERTRLFLQGSLPAVEGAKVTKALDRLADQIAASPEDIDPDDPATTIDARRADALALMASHAIAEDADPDRATLVLHATLDTALDIEGNAVMAGGNPLPKVLMDRLMCDARIQMVTHDADGGVTGIGFTSRDIPPWLRRQVEHRDRHRCTFPGCGRTAFLQPHHIVPWPLGPTDMTNLTMVCPTHHKLVHEFGWHVTLGKDGMARWFRPDWRPYQPRPRPTQVEVEEIEQTELRMWADDVQMGTLKLEMAGVF